MFSILAANSDQECPWGSYKSLSILPLQSTVAAASKICIHADKIVNLRLIHFRDFKNSFDWMIFKNILQVDVKVVEYLGLVPAALKPLLKSPVSWFNVCKWLFFNMTPRSIYIAPGDTYRENSLILFMEKYPKVYYTQLSYRGVETLNR